MLSSAMLSVEWPLTRAPMRRGTPPDATISAAVSQLAAVKARVPGVRTSRGKRAWDQVVNRPVTRPRPQGHEVASRAYHKMMEIQLSCALPFPRRSLHLCEAPGGFVQAVYDGMKDAASWSWVATSLATSGSPQPATALLPMHHGRFLVGDDLPGGCDVDNAACVEALASMEAFDLVTADGAVEMDHDHLERAHLPLLLSETRAAMRCLQTGGNVVMKFFEGGDLSTQTWIAWMTTQFERVSIIKPTASRATNSERYLVAREYRASDEELSSALGKLDAWVVAPAWSRELQRVVDRMAKDQSVALDNAMSRLS